MSRLEKHIADYAAAIEDQDGAGRSEAHKALCEHLGIPHDTFKPFEDADRKLWFTSYAHSIPRAEAARIIRKTIDKLFETGPIKDKPGKCHPAWQFKDKKWQCLECDKGPCNAPIAVVRSIENAVDRP